MKLGKYTIIFWGWDAQGRFSIFHLWRRFRFIPRRDDNYLLGQAEPFMHRRQWLNVEIVWDAKS
jgi:hypothetical protein